MSESPSLAELVTLVVRHRVRRGHEDAYEAWLRRIVRIAGEREGHLGVSVMRDRQAGLQQFTSVLRFCSTDAAHRWLDSPERRTLIEEAAPMLADGDQIEVAPQREFWFTPPADGAPPPPRWKQAVVSMLVILPLTLLVPLAWGPLLQQLPWLSGYVPSTVVITLTIVLLVVYLMMPAATRLLAPWLNADAARTQP